MENTKSKGMTDRMSESILSRGPENPVLKSDTSDSEDSKGKGRELLFNSGQSNLAIEVGEGPPDTTLNVDNVDPDGILPQLKGVVLSSADLDAIITGATAFCNNVIGTAPNDMWAAVAPDSVPTTRIFARAAVYVAPYLLGKLAQNCVGPFSRSSAPVAFGLGLAIARTLSSDLERRLRSAPDHSGVEDYLNAQALYIEALLAGDNDAAHRYEQLMNEQTQAVTDRVVQSFDPPPFALSDRPMLGAAVRELLTQQSRQAIGLALLISGGLLPLLNAHLGSNRLTLSAVDFAISAACLLGGSFLAALGDMLLVRHLQKAPGGTSQLESALAIAQGLQRKLQAAKSLSDGKKAKLSTIEEGKLDQALKDVEQRLKGLRNGIRLAALAAAPEPTLAKGTYGLHGLHGLLGKTILALSTFMALMPVMAQQGWINLALGSYPGIPHNGTYDAMQGQVATEGFWPSLTVGASAVACVTLLAPPINFLLRSAAAATTGLVTRLVGGGASGGSPATAGRRSDDDAEEVAIEPEPEPEIPDSLITPEDEAIFQANALALLKFS